MNVKYKITDPIGLHARPASLIVTTASKFKSSITFKYLNKTGNAKSIMNLMALGVKSGGEVEIIITGEDEEQAGKAIIETMQKAKLI